MENRFGFRDLVICVLLIAVIILITLAMFQYDRQWEKMKTIEGRLGDQTKDLAELRRMLANGISVTSRPAGPGSAGNWPDPFERMKAAQAMPGYAPGDWMVDAFGANVRCITPLITADAYGAAIGGYITENLAVRDPNTLEWQPLLADSWKISDDGLTITFHIRKGVTFSDGEPFTAQDVQFSYDWVMNPKVEDPRVRESISDKLESVKATSDEEVVFKFKEPYFESFGMAAGLDILPKHFYSKYTPEQFNKHPGLLMGTGPYRMETPDGWAPGKLLVLYRNDRYWGTPAAFDRLVFHEINNEVARLTMFRNGKLDYLSAQPEQFIEIKKDKELLARTLQFEFERPTSGYGFIAWNQERKGKPTPFADKRVRQAMTMMIDTSKLFNEILLGYGIPVTGPFNRLSKQSDPDLKPYPFDVEKAKNLLKEAGFTIHPDGVVYGPDGQPFKFTVTFPSGTGFWDKVLLLLRDNLAKAGVIMELDPLEWAVFEDRLKSHDFDALCMAWGGGIESDIRQMFHSSQIADADNWMSYRNPELDKLIDQARSCVDEKKRMPLWQACHRIIYEDQPYTFLYSRRQTTVIDNRIKNVQVVKVGLNDRTEWFVDKPNQKWKEKE